MLLTAIPKDNEVAAMSDVGERVKKIVVKHLGVEAEKVTENAGFIEGLGADSLDTIELVMAFEDEFGCVWLIASILRRMRTRLPMCRSVGFGAFFAAVIAMADCSRKAMSKSRPDAGTAESLGPR